MKKGQPSFEFERKKTPRVKRPVKSPADQEITNSEIRYGIVSNSKFVSIREKPEEAAKVKDYLASGEEVEILGEKSGFYQIRYGRIKRVGFISCDFCREVSVYDDDGN